MPANRNKIKRKIINIFLLVFFLPLTILAQKKDDTINKKHSPTKATYLALIPGVGQIYNKKYWKLPIVYAGFGTISYFVVINRKEYIKYKDAYKCKIQYGDECTNELAQKYSEENLRNIRNYYRRNMQLSYIIGGGWYILQIIDAVVDANLYYWNVTDDISLKIEPVININNSTQTLPESTISDYSKMNGLKISVNF
jgi:hypothetical protein